VHRAKYINKPDVCLSLYLGGEQLRKDEGGVTMKPFMLHWKDNDDDGDGDGDGDDEGDY
jgi:hypothetical protein